MQYGYTHSLTLNEAIEYISAKGERFKELDKKFRTTKKERLKKVNSHRTLGGKYGK